MFWVFLTWGIALKQFLCRVSAMIRFHVGLCRDAVCLAHGIIPTLQIRDFLGNIRHPTKKTQYQFVDQFQMARVFNTAQLIQLINRVWLDISTIWCYHCNTNSGLNGLTLYPGALTVKAQFPSWHSQLLPGFPNPCRASCGHWVFHRWWQHVAKRKHRHATDSNHRVISSCFCAESVLV